VGERNCDSIVAGRGCPALDQQSAQLFCRWRLYLTGARHRTAEPIEGVHHVEFLYAYRCLSLLITLAGVVACNAGEGRAVAVPNPAVDATLATAKSEQSAVISGGCFWGIQAVFSM